MIIALHRLLLLSALLLPATALAQQDDVPVFVHMPRGANATEVSGTLAEGASTTYLLEARTAESLLLQASGSNGIELRVYAPGETAPLPGGPHPQRFSALLPTTGVYRLQLRQTRQPDGGAALARYTLKISLR